MTDVLFLIAAAALVIGAVGGTLPRAINSIYPEDRAEWIMLTILLVGAAALFVTLALGEPA